MADLWQSRREAAARAVEPLAARMRPRTLDEVAGQRHILGPGKLLRRMLDADRLTSILLHGPPGTGKTTLAEVIARHLDRHFERENASSVGVARIRQIIEEARARLGESGRRTVLFLDEIHRFSKSQQDVLLADVERGLITLIGATTENPLFAVNSALVSRSTLFRLESLSEEDVVAVLRRAIGDAERGYGKMDLRVEEEALRVWAVKSDGDARRALTALEVAVLSGGSARTTGRARVPTLATPRADELPVPPIAITRADAEESIQQKAAVYDGTGDQHYDAASAMIKSVRGSDPDAAMYWIAYMLEAGEDPRFIARRLAILASEDIGNADPRGIMVAAAAWELVERIGMPEARITLAQCATYLALAPKSNASYVAIEEAMGDVREGRTIAVPRHIKDGNVRKAGDMSEGGAGGARGEGYNYTHEAGIESRLLGKVGAQDYLGVEKRYYRPTEHGAEKMLKERLEEARRLRAGRASEERA
ncbi:MAG TPA: replication-associated recombination protein A [Phycisphaerales bacterium]|nr:replication-associated recombination protein A [Phycisphaerales bacterium]